MRCAGGCTLGGRVAFVGVSGATAGRASRGRWERTVTVAVQAGSGASAASGAFFASRARVRSLPLGLGKRGRSTGKAGSAGIGGARMVMTESEMVELGTTAPPFSLPDVSTGELVSLDSLYADSPPPKALLVVFLCAHCPFVKHVAGEVARLSADVRSGKYGAVKMIGISSNSVETHPEDAPERMAEEIVTRKYQFPILYDETQEVARSWHAACTPDFFILDQDRKVYYRGRLDASRPGNNVPVTGEDLRNALSRCVQGQPPPEKQLPSMGCNIKWKPGTT